MNESALLGERSGRQPTPREIVDRKLRRIGRDRAKLEYETCVLLLEGQRVGVHRSYGYASSHAEVVAIDGEPTRATQTIPPRIQRQVRLRHHDRCAVPGCRNAIVDLHHVDERAEGGTHDPNRLVPLCGAHHDAAHRHVLLVSGDAITGFVFAHADGRAYEKRPRIASTIVRASRAL